MDVLVLVDRDAALHYAIAVTALGKSKLHGNSRGHLGDWSRGNGGGEGDADEGKDGEHERRLHVDGFRRRKSLVMRSLEGMDKGCRGVMLISRDVDLMKFWMFEKRLLFGYWGL